MNDLIDVVIPSYNRLDLTTEAIISVMTQSYDNLRLYVIEDGSRLLEDSIASFNDNRIVYKSHAKSHGPSFARNLGASLGQGKFIAFLDSDDLWYGNKLDEQHKYFAEHKSINYLHTNELWLKDGDEVKQLKIHQKIGGQFLERAFTRCLISPSSIMFRRDFWQQHGQFNEHFQVAEDYELWLRLQVRFPVGFLKEELTIKRAGSWMQLSRQSQIDRQRVLALHLLYRHYKDNHYFYSLRQEWLTQFEKKIKLLLKGAIKHNNLAAQKEYSSWHKLSEYYKTQSYFK